MPFGKSCIICQKRQGETILVQAIESGSGPGWGLYACPSPCAQEYAGRSYAPSWLQEDLRQLGLWPPTN
ncbi:hypothetical protein [Streptomyces bathyalis]|uniref:hypothetical protein n=1 Tax=Streptomyces bathyalis TaxID=2710756 RepID=UPI001A9CB500|nr:hypothetical protein [Streptomyces bathyalis]